MPIILQKIDGDESDFWNRKDMMVMRRILQQANVRMLNDMAVGFSSDESYEAFKTIFKAISELGTEEEVVNTLSLVVKMVQDISIRKKDDGTLAIIGWENALKLLATKGVSDNYISSLNKLIGVVSLSHAGFDGKVYPSLIDISESFFEKMIKYHINLISIYSQMSTFPKRFFQTFIRSITNFLKVKDPASNEQLVSIFSSSKSGEFHTLWYPLIFDDKIDQITSLTKISSTVDKNSYRGMVQETGLLMSHLNTLIDYVLKNITWDDDVSPTTKDSLETFYRLSGTNITVWNSSTELLSYWLGQHQ